MRSSTETPLEANRFSALLNPIRDLASSWGVDVAKELADYAETLGINVDAEDKQDQCSHPVDFATAALLVQASTSIYSRKVEHLYGLVYTAVSSLNQLRSKRHQTESEHGAQPGNGTEADASLDMDEIDFLTLDDDVPQADAGAITLAGKLHAPDGSVRDETCLPSVPPMLIHRSVEAANNLGGASYKMNSTHMHPSGAMVMEGCPPLNENLDTLPTQNAGEPDVDVTQPFELHGMDADDDDESQDFGFGTFEDSHSSKILQVVDTDEKGDAMAAASRSIMEIAAKYGITSANPTMKQTKVVKDPYLMLDPHEEIPTLNKPTKAGKTYRRPRNINHSLERDKIDELPSNADLVKFIMGAIPRNTSICSYVMSQELRPSYATLLRKRKALKRKRISQDGRTGDSGPGLHTAQEIKDEPEQMEVGGFLGDDDDGFSSGQHDDPDSPDHLRLPGSNSEDELKLTLFDDIDNEVQVNSRLAYLASSYEETCRKHLEKTAWMWEQRTTDVELMKRVEEWTARIQPLLEEEERRVDFDISRYSQKVMTNLEERLDVDDTAEIRISSLVGESSNFEVCRMFLATLQLANSYVVEIVPPVGCDVSDFVVRPCSRRHEKKLGREVDSSDKENQGRSIVTPAKSRTKRIRETGTTPKSYKRQPLRPRLHCTDAVQASLDNKVRTGEV